MTLSIAVDGPAAAGKGTLARRLAATLGLPHLDTGLLYRAVGRRVLDAAMVHEIYWKWVGGQAGDVMNERADRLATAAREGG